MFQVKSRLCEGLTSVIACCVFAVLFCVSNVASSSAFFVVNSAKIVEQRGGADAEIISVGSSNIRTNTRLDSIGDAIVYEIEIKNNDSESHTIDSIVDNNTNQNIVYSYDRHENFEVAAGESFVLEVTAKYESEATGSLIALDTVFTIKFEGKEESLNSGIETNDMFVSYVAMALVSGVIVLFLVKKDKKKTLVVFVCAAALSVPSAANALELRNSDFVLQSVYAISGRTHSIDISVSDPDEWKSSKTIEINYSAVGNGIKNQYSLDDGQTWQNYEVPFVVTENLEIRARSMYMGENPIVTGEATVSKIDTVVPTVSITLDDTYYSGEALDLSSVTTYTAGESGATVRWYIDDFELSNLSDTYLIDRLEEQYEVKVKAVATSGAGLSGEGNSETIIIKYARWDDYLIGPLTRDNIGNIKFIKWSEMPGDEADWTDISVNRDGAVMEYYNLDNTTNLYDVYISSPYGYSRYKDDTLGSNLSLGVDIDIEHDDDEIHCMSPGVKTGMFAYMPNLKTIDFAYLDMFNITDMSCMFANVDFNTDYWTATSALTTIDWGDKFNTKNVKNFSYAFTGLESLKSLDLSSFDVSSADSIYGIFARNESLETLDLANWDTSNIRTMNYAFYSTPKLVNYDVSHWNVSNVERMTGMFYAAGIEAIDLSHWDVSNVKTFYQFFENANKLASVNLGGWDTSSVVDMSYMFNRTAISTVDVSSFDTSKVQRMGDMFSKTSNLRSLDLSNFNTSNVWDMNGMFYLTGMTEVNLDNFDTSKVKDFAYFACRSKLQTISIRKLDFSSGTDFFWMFEGANKLKNIYVETIPTIPAGARTNNMWRGSGVTYFTVKEYSD